LPPSDGKHALRERVLAARLKLSPELRTARSRAACERLAGLEEFRAARAVALYASIGAEVETGPLAEEIARAGKALAWPRAVSPGRVLGFAVAARDELVPGPRGTREPPAAAPALPADALDLVVVPGVAFDADGRRLGRGGGFYDATLAALPERVARLALAFELQVVDAVPDEPHDAAVDAVVTEARVLRPLTARRLRAFMPVP
jgi:5-formyltetrahydrofolate cyclo-ligase